jgi:hypothetical protein
MAKIENFVETTNSAVILSTSQKSDLVGRIKFDADMVSLTDLWREAGSPKGKEVKDWLKRESATEIIDTVAQILNVQKMHVLKINRGRGGGTYAHKNIALAYAKWLDPKLHVLVNELFFQRMEEEKNPDLITERAIRTYKKHGKSDEWIRKRLNGKLTRNGFTACLSAHGVEQEGFRNCTNGIYAPLFGGSSNVVREKLGIAKKENIRDNMTGIHLAAVQFSEALAQQKIEDENLRGNAKCEIACMQSAKIVANAINQNTQKIG